MIPKNNIELFVRKYGHLWFLRDFDYLPERLEYYDRCLSTEFMKEVEKGNFKVFKTEEEARAASKQVRSVLGLLSPFEKIENATESTIKKLIREESIKRPPTKIYVEMEDGTLRPVKQVVYNV